MATIDPLVAKNRIDSSARIKGQSWIRGKNTTIGSGATIIDSYLENVTVEAGAIVKDSVIESAQGAHRSPARNPFVDRWAMGGGSSCIGQRATVEHATLLNTIVGKETVCRHSAFRNSTLGPWGAYHQTYGESLHAQSHVRVKGPTELSEAWLGHHARIDQIGYYEGIFSNDFYVLEFDTHSGQLLVKETLDLPHVSRYGMNTINSANSGKLMEQPDGILRDLGDRQGGWYDPLLSHEPIMLGPCCWVGGWTKVIGKSPFIPDNAEELVRDSLATYIMPFAVCGMDGEAIMGQVMHGESNNAYSYKNRTPAWTFLHAPSAVIAMVRRLLEAGCDSKLADRVVELSIRNALALTQAYANERNIDLADPARKSTKGWRGWLTRSKSILEILLESKLWEFHMGEPTAWKQVSGKWTPANDETAKALDLDKAAVQYTETGILACGQGVLQRTMGIPPGALPPAQTANVIDPRANVSPKAILGPGVHVRGNSIVEEGAQLFRTVVENGVVGKNTRLVRTRLQQTSVGEGTVVVSSSLKRSSCGKNGQIRAARLMDSRVGDHATLNPFGEMVNSTVSFPTIIGTTMRDSSSDSFMMSYHMAGQISGLDILPTVITLNGEPRRVRGVPMLGGGLRILGDEKKRAALECSFIGSNAILEGGCYVGFGAFVLGRLTAGEGLPPFTVSTAPGPERDQIGAVASQMASVVITHFQSWAFQVNDPGQSGAIGSMISEILKQGRDAVRWAIQQHRKNSWDATSDYAKYKSLRNYSLVQLESGLRTYEGELSDDRWHMEYREGTLCFAGKGKWKVVEGIARWEKD